MENVLSHISPEDQILVNKILDTAQELFLTIGVRSTTMDDLAGHLGMSKKTLYRFINNKADLVHYCVKKEIGTAQDTIIGITAGSEDAIEEMMKIGAMVIESLKKFSANTIYELKKFYPKSWDLVEQHHNQFIFNVIKNNLLKGINEGLYRPEIRVDILSKLYIGKSQYMLEIEEIAGKKYNLSEIYVEFFNYHVRGIASPRGVGKLAIYKNKIKISE